MSSNSEDERNRDCELYGENSDESEPSDWDEDRQEENVFTRQRCRDDEYDTSDFNALIAGDVDDVFGDGEAYLE